jgi:methylenetetrahydrofolate dehydrogenase (NADP+)/methenyltetrahydrofolate cyclohydrolase
MIIFDGYAFAQQKEAQLVERVAQLKNQGVQLKIAAILFTEDAGSQLYTRLKKEAAERAGMSYEIFSFSMTDPIEKILATVEKLNNDSAITGIIIQKPSKKRWLETMNGTAEEFISWWQKLVHPINPGKDVDGLHPTTLQAVEKGTWREERKVLPATAKAVLSILEEAKKILSGQPLAPDWSTKKFAVIGKSDILGKPLFYELRNQGYQVELLGTKELNLRKEQGQNLLDMDVVISATGASGIITAEMIKQYAIIIDVGEPSPDVNQTSVAEKAAFLTPVPGGVGPVTVVSLLENAVSLVS